MSSLRSDRARRRATKLRTTRIVLIIVFLLVIAVGGYFIYTKLAQPAATENVAILSNGENMITTTSGLKYEDLTVGSGAEAVAGKTVSVHYTGWLENGTKFDSSLDRGEPFMFQLGAGEVIAGWDEGVAGMKVGGKRQLVIPSDLGYGARGAGGVIPPNATLIFEVELLAIQ